MVRIVSAKTDAEVLQDIESMILDMSKEVDFTIVECSAEMSKSGNDMFAMKLKLSQNGVGFGTIKDWIVFNVPGFPEKKLKDFLKSIDAIDLYEDLGEFNPSDIFERVEGKTFAGKLKLKFGKPYLDKETQEMKKGREVDYYVVPVTLKAVSPIKAVVAQEQSKRPVISELTALGKPQGFQDGSNFDDDIPF